MSSLVSIENLSFKYPKSRDFALRNVSLEIEEGSFFAFLGPNGAGKTTLMRLLCGRLPGFTGNLGIASAYRDARGFLNPAAYGVLLENPGVYLRLTVAEYLCYFAGFYGIGRTEALSRGEEILEQISGPSLDAKLSQLSLGNRQKLQIARAVLHGPKVLILDEPVANLDPESREQVWSYIGEWRNKLGGTAIVCSHILAEMESEATDYAIIDRGKLLRVGSLDRRQSKDEMTSTHFDVEFARPVEKSLLRQALAAAGLEPVELNDYGTSLADIYKSTVRQ